MIECRQVAPQLDQLLAALALTATATVASRLSTAQPAPAEPTAAGYDATTEADRSIATLKVQPGDWPQWGGSGSRNNTPAGKNILTEWIVKTGHNIKWTVPLGYVSFGNPVVANGQVYVGTNNGAAYDELRETSASPRPRRQGREPGVLTSCVILVIVRM